MTHTVLSVLTEARRLIADMNHWIQEELAQNRDGLVIEPNERGACAWCADGAVRKVLDMGIADPDVRTQSIYFQVRAALERAAKKLFTPDYDYNPHSFYVAVNDGEIGIPDNIMQDDAHSRAHDNTLAVFDTAIAEAA